MYIFIRRVENVARSIFNRTLLVQYCNENLSLELKNRFNNNELISAGWAAITKDMENEMLGEKLKNEVFTKWINIRASAFVKAWLAQQRLAAAQNKAKEKQDKENNKKRKATSTTGSIISEKGAPSLRKSLTK